MVDLTQSSDFDVGIFQVYQAIGRSMYAPLILEKNGKKLAASLAHELSLKLGVFDLSWKLSSGVNMEELWNVFRPNTALNMAQLEVGLRIKELANRFDLLKFDSGASVRELGMLQSSIVHIYAITRITSLQDSNSLDVCRDPLPGYNY